MRITREEIKSYMRGQNLKEVIESFGGQFPRTGVTVWVPR